LLLLCEKPLVRANNIDASDESRAGDCPANEAGAQSTAPANAIIVPSFPSASLTVNAQSRHRYEWGMLNNSPWACCTSDIG
jgi:hypothetical protein